MAGAGEGKIYHQGSHAWAKEALGRTRGFLPVGGLAVGPSFPKEPGESQGGGVAPVTYRTRLA